MTSEELKEAKDILQALRGKNKYDYADRALEICREHDEYGEFIDEYELDERVKHEAEDGAQRVMCFLAKCDNLNPPYGWRLDGYGNAEETTLADIEMKLEDIIKDNEE